jgi:hypothetical protein
MIPELEQLILRMLSENLQDRGTASKLGDALDAVADGPGRARLSLKLSDRGMALPQLGT